ncbi:hypothetical protein NLU13_6602 [Sarocladium strictum]|uniref:Uncharacterized protein n=1 Tax=Sarocladium strictum TaxID=5046 RepID=A0AA39GGJ4_SARSR|nr:hypothetical protein NLU13_6602 [Sarocladium strictum]
MSSIRRAPRHDAQPQVRRKVYAQVTPQARQYALTGEFTHSEVDRRGSSDVAGWCPNTAKEGHSVEEDLALVREVKPHVHAWLQAESEGLDAVVSQQNRSRVIKSESVWEVASGGSETSQSSASSWTLDGATTSSSSGSSLSLPSSSLPSSASQSTTMSQRNRTRREQAQAHRSTTNEVKQAALTELRLEAENKALHQQVLHLLQEASELTGRSYLPILDSVLTDKTLAQANIVLETALRDAAIEVTRLRGQAKTRHSRNN